MADVDTRGRDIDRVLDEVEQTAWAGLAPDRYAWAAGLRLERRISVTYLWPGDRRAWSLAVEVGSRRTSERSTFAGNLRRPSLAHRKMSVAVWVLSTVLASACSSDSTEGSAVDAPPTTSGGVSAPAGNPPYEIIGRDRSGNARCSFDVRLEERVPESSIRNIAEEIKRREAEECERTFIVHYLPGMQVDAGSWATSHFTPNLEVQILGMTAEQANGALPLPDGEVVGRWRDESPPGRWLTIVRRDDQLIERWDYADGSNSEDSLDESRLPDGRVRFEDQGGNANGD